MPGGAIPGGAERHALGLVDVRAGVARAGHLAEARGRRGRQRCGAQRGPRGCRGRGRPRAGEAVPVPQRRRARGVPRVPRARAKSRGVRVFVQRRVPHHRRRERPVRVPVEALRDGRGGRGDDQRGGGGDVDGGGGLRGLRGDQPGDEDGGRRARRRRAAVRAGDFAGRETQPRYSSRVRPRPGVAPRVPAVRAVHLRARRLPARAGRARAVRGGGGAGVCARLPRARRARQPLLLGARRGCVPRRGAGRGVRPGDEHAEVPRGRPHRRGHHRPRGRYRLPGAAPHGVHLRHRRGWTKPARHRVEQRRREETAGDSAGFPEKSGGVVHVFARRRVALRGGRGLEPLVGGVPVANRHDARVEQRVAREDRLRELVAVPGLRGDVRHQAPRVLEHEPLREPEGGAEQEGEDADHVVLVLPRPGHHGGGHTRR